MVGWVRLEVVVKKTRVSQFDLASSPKHTRPQSPTTNPKLTLDQTPPIQLSSLEFNSDYVTYTFV